MKKHAYVFLYENFADFEISQALLLLVKEYNITTVGFNNTLVKSYTGLSVKADIAIEELSVNKVDLFLIPGGEPKECIWNKKLTDKISCLNEKLTLINSVQKTIAAICGGPTFLANAGILDDRQCTATINEDEASFYTNAQLSNDDYVIDDNIITAQGKAFSLFAVQLAKMIGVIKSDEELLETLNWLQNK